MTKRKGKEGRLPNSHRHPFTLFPSSLDAVPRLHISFSLSSFFFGQTISKNRILTSARGTRSMDVDPFPFDPRLRQHSAHPVQ